MRAQRTTLEKVRVLQRKLYRAAKAQPQRTFGVLFDKVCSLEVLWVAWAQVRRNRGAAGVDGETIESIEAKGTLWFLLELREELMQQTYRPQPVRRVFIPKPDGRQRPLGIPGVKDRVAQGAVISPLLSNIYLHPLDLYWEREVKATKMVRYADDLVVLCRWKPPETYMPKLRQFLARLRVTVNEDKTRMVAAQDGFDFLGVHFRKQPSRRDASKWFCYCWPSPRSMQRIRVMVKKAIGRDNRTALQYN